ncbi:glycosyltransferase family 4 protein [Larsenimonas salina]|uniref:glycosyltransferase family 4 protein n=1 Tax=Larsenimonas salina TaxID=1295565 RepID=UPI002073BDAF|nr:glycosyltransferase family 1 protein [Larsenimonas salina]MCM5703424.1 glycosyltransferase family 1 protein [Larsenimonas salina]
MSRIAFVSETWAPEINGVAHTLTQIANELLERGFELQLVRPRPVDRQNDPHVVKELQVLAIPIPDYEGVRMGVPAPLKLIRFWKVHRPDAVYIATEGPLGLSALFAANHLGLPVVSGFHTNFDQYSEHYILLKMLRPFVRPFLKRFHNKSAITLVPTSSQANALKAKGYKNTKVMGRGLDPKRFTPAFRSDPLRDRWGAAEDDLVVLYVGRLAAEKNVPLMVNALQALHSKDPSIKAVFVGDGPMRKELEETLSWAEFAGFQEGDALASYYASADLFLFPSRSETFGNVVTEAMASGLACVALDYAAAGELITSGQEGLLVDYSDDKGFIDASLTLGQDLERTRRMGKAAKERVNQMTWSSICDQFVDYLHQAQEVSDARTQFSNV